MIDVNVKAVDFCLTGTDENGIEREFCLKDFLGKGKDIVVYFYPKDDTSGCTQEACDFRDNFSRISEKAFVLGISPDDVMSHKKFREKHSLNFPLLSDVEHKVLEDYGAWGIKNMYGKSYMGVIRSTFLINESGSVKKVWRNVHVKGHVDEVIKIL